MLATAPAEDVRVTHAVYRRFGYDYWQQRPDGRIALGGGRDAGGEAEETAARGVTDAVQAHLERLLREEVGTSAAITHRWSGIVGYSGDDLPIADEVAPGVFACGAYSGHGNVLGALAAESLVDLALGRPLPPLVRWLREVRAASPAENAPA
jgi:glycine/D-amino acid oxidase-like deaminating enzyme